MTEPTFNKDGYPTDDALKAIREWDAKDFLGLIAFVRAAWHWPDYATFDDGVLILHTGGWSGNECIIGALSDNLLFWSMCWYCSCRGGHHEFRLPKQRNEGSE